MIVGDIANFTKEVTLYPSVIQKALAYLKATDFAGVPNGKHSIDGDQLYIVVSEYVTSPIDNRKAEAHERYIDIQYLIQGKELIGYASEGNGEVQEDLLAEKDVVFYTGLQNEEFICLNPGTFVIAFPWDIHRPGCMAQESCKVRKAVLKIAMNALLPR